MTRSSTSLPTEREPQRIDRKFVVEINRRHKSNKQKLRDAAKKGLSK